MNLYRLFILAVLYSFNVSWAISFTVPSNVFKTISLALSKARKGDTVFVEQGTYKENIFIGNGITLLSKELHKAVIDGKGLERAVTLVHNAVISGFSIINGGIGIYTEGKDNVVTRCKIYNNLQSGIVCVGNMPNIEDNIIVFNKGSGIQGWDVRSTVFIINHNTIAYNTNNGIALGGKSEINIENNIIAFNEKLGIKAESDVKARLVKNVFYYNGDLLPVLPEDNFSFDPMFVNAKIMNFNLSNDSKCKNMASDNTNIGTRFIY